MTFKIEFSDEDIVEAYMDVKDYIRHTDAPTELEMILVRDQLIENAKDAKDAELPSLFWLRNRVVALRKKGAFSQ